MALEYFPWYNSYLKKCEKLTDQELGRLMRALMMYNDTGERKELDGRESIAFDFIADDIDRAKAAYDAKCAKNKKNIESRYERIRPNTDVESRYERIRPNTDVSEEKEKESPPLSPPSLLPPVTPIISPPYNPPSEKEEKKIITPAIPDGIAAPLQGATPKKRFVPPTLAEVQSYVAERQSPVDPQEFIDFYMAKGWMVGKTPMKDWKAACRNAEKWDRWHYQPPRTQAPRKSWADIAAEMDAEEGKQ